MFVPPAVHDSCLPVRETFNTFVIIVITERAIQRDRERGDGTSQVVQSINSNVSLVRDPTVCALYTHYALHSCSRRITSDLSFTSCCAEYCVKSSVEGSKDANYTEIEFFVVFLNRGNNCNIHRQLARYGMTFLPI